LKTGDIKTNEPSKINLVV